MLKIIPIAISEEAKKQIHQTLSSKLLDPAYGIRVGLRGAGCGASYLLGFDKPTENDEIYILENIRLIIDRRHLMYLVGLTLDYTQTTDGFGFVIEKKLP